MEDALIPVLEPFVKPGVKFTILSLETEQRDFLVTRGWSLMNGEPGSRVLAVTRPRVVKKGWPLDSRLRGDVIVLKGHDKTEPVFPSFDPAPRADGGSTYVLDLWKGSRRVVDAAGDGGASLLLYLKQRLILHTLTPASAPVQLLSRLDPDTMQRDTLDVAFQLKLLEALGQSTYAGDGVVMTPPQPPRKILLTDAMKTKLKAREGKPAKPIMKIFDPAGAGTWLLCSMEPDDDTLWAVCDIGQGVVEYGTVSLTELETAPPKVLGLRLERDKFFRGTPLSVAELCERSSLQSIPVK